MKNKEREVMMTDEYDWTLQEQRMRNYWKQQKTKNKERKVMMTNDKTRNYFSELFGIVVKKHIKLKGKYSYLPWAVAWRMLKDRYPHANYSVVHFDDKDGLSLPYQFTPLGYFVQVRVKIPELLIEHTEMLPVIGYSNKPIEKPNVMDINTAIKRCLAKAIALHGIGLALWVGEDVPDGANGQKVKGKTEKKAKDLADRLTKATNKRLNVTTDTTDTTGNGEGSWPTGMTKEEILDLMPKFTGKYGEAKVEKVMNEFDCKGIEHASKKTLCDIVETVMQRYPK